MITKMFHSCLQNNTVLLRFLGIRDLEVTSPNNQISVYHFLGGGKKPDFPRENGYQIMFLVPIF